MTRAAFNSGYEEVGALRLRFEEFRNAHAKRTRLPEELWRAAAEIAQKHGLNVVARSLGLDTNSLKKWMGHRGNRQPAKRKGTKRRVNTPGFVELFAPVSSAASSCVLEVESSQGGKLRLEWKGVTSGEVAQLIRAFAGQ
jgi:hypothetical protein